ncbi:MAG: purine-nucleoside phosphorylase [Proteobacteria bacterium]|nr:purine-nucleoside phosphorylase [Pseudomonadota bacterium]
MNKKDLAKEAALVIQQAQLGFSPRLGIVLGSGLSSIAEQMTATTEIDYKKIPGFPVTKVKGHLGKLVLGQLENVPTICMQGRSHFYETGNYDSVVTYIRTLKLLGCQSLILVNSAGSLHADIGPGSIVAIKDHINFQPGNPLVGENDDAYGVRFPALDEAYDPMFIEQLITCAQSLKINIHTGIYACATGPSFETIAEISAFRMLGADLVGMSTVPEVIVAHHCGMKILAISSVSNLASGLSKVSHDHNQVVATSEEVSKKLGALIKAFVKDHVAR